MTTSCQKVYIAGLGLLVVAVETMSGDHQVAEDCSRLMQKILVQVVPDFREEVHSSVSAMRMTQDGNGQAAR